MRNQIYHLTLAVLLLCSDANAQGKNKLEERAHYALKVTDELNLPVEGASLKIFNYSADDATQPKGETDSKGFVSILANWAILSEVSVHKVGYYPVTSVKIPKDVQKPTQDPQKSFGVVLKSIRNPIGLHAKNLTREGAGPLVVPVESREVGYDLLVGDWVQPHGKGKTSDFIFFCETKFVSDSKYWRKISLRFSNKQDGVIPFEAPLHQGSSLVSDYQAPEHGYLPEWHQVTSRSESKPNESTRKEERNFYFQVRSQLDRRGNVVSAHYGKIYGDFMSFIYYLNPAPNDRNVEFATDKNLFQDLHWRERVSRP